MEPPRGTASRRLRRAGRVLLGGDPESSVLMRLIGNALLAVNVLFNHDPPTPAWLWWVLGGTYACWLVFAGSFTRWPRLSFAALACCALVSAAAAGPAPDSSMTVLLCVAVSVFAQHILSRITTILTLFAACAALLVATSLLAQRSAASIAAHVAILVILLLLGLYRRQYRLRVRETELLLEQTRRAQHEHARAAALDERARIAREMHDVLAHSLGALTVQLEVAEGLLGEKGDVAGALARLRQSRRLAADGLAEARGAVAALRSDVPPLPEALHELVEGYRRDHHLRVSCRVDGPPRSIGPAATVSLLRTAREALTNAGKHAPGEAVAVTLEFLPDRVRLTTRNPLAAKESTGPDGYGLTGMRERIALVGGTLSAGPDGDGWLVAAEVPE
ncbi:sensor histidine kinase [Nocardia blacklockiae]|uniref:sensor histidine kinase n=1 Tax=Nocardia blacklockiae TaxID=480036 RepID=UPI002B4B315B|nr:histidine kinase [Nocardia blacklockiae]